MRAGWLTELSGIGPALAPTIFIVAVFASFLVVTIFRRRVRISLEREQPNPDTQQSQTFAAPDAEPKPVPADLRWPTLLTDATGHRKRLARLYMIAGVGLAIAFAAVGTITTADRSHPSLFSFLYSAVCFSSPLIVIARSIYGRWAPWLVRVAIAAAVLAVLSQALPFANDETETALVMAALLALLLHPGVRAMGPLALGFFSIVFVGSAAATVSALSERDVDRRLASFDHAADPDGRFRVNEVFCLGDATWQHAVRRLLADSHCVLMDVRGFTRYRAGCVFEIGCLAKSAAGSRIVFLVNSVTDRGFIGEVWANATHAASAEAPSNTRPSRVCIRSSGCRARLRADHCRILECASGRAHAHPGGEVFRVG